MKMLKLFGLVGLAAAGMLISGCQTIRDVADEYRDWRTEQEAAKEKPDAPTTPETQPQPDKPETPTQPEAPPTGDNTFLWKPVSESRGGRCAVITPAKLVLSKVHVNGANNTAEYAGRANGNRQHWFQNKTGSAFGANVKVEAFDKASGQVVRTWVVPNGGARWGAN